MRELILTNERWYVAFKVLALCGGVAIIVVSAAVLFFWKVNREHHGHR